MIVNTDFWTAVSYARSHNIMIRPEYWALWIKYDKERADFVWVDKSGKHAYYNGNVNIVNLTDKIMDTTKWEFMCNKVEYGLISPFSIQPEEYLGHKLTEV